MPGSPIQITGHGTEITIKAISIKDTITSQIISNTYTINYAQVTTPELSFASGTYDADLQIDLTVATEDATIYYTSDGSIPTDSATEYIPGTPISISGHDTETTIRAIALRPGFANSEEATATYIIAYNQVSTPAFSVNGGDFTSSQTVALTTATEDAEIIYTTDNSDPALSETAIIYADPITIEQTTTLRAIARKNGMLDSSIIEATYNINLITNQVAAPIFTINQTPVASGFYEDSQSITIQSSTPGATILYTTTGDIPGNNTLTDRDNTYYSPVTVFNKYLKAIAILNGMQNSTVQTLYIRQQDFPEIVSVTPDNPSIEIGENFNLSVTVADNDGYSDIKTLRTSIRADGHGTTNLTSDVLLLRYDTGNSFYVVDWNFETNSAVWVRGYFNGSEIIETYNSFIDTSQCTISASGTTIVLNYNITPKAEFSAVSTTKMIWVWTQDRHLNELNKNDHNAVSEMGSFQLITE